MLRSWRVSTSSGKKISLPYLQMATEIPTQTLSGEHQEISGDPNHTFPKVLLYKWEAYCTAKKRRAAVQNGRCTAGFPFLQGLEARKAQQYKWGVYCRTNWGVLQYFSDELYGLGVPKCFWRTGNRCRKSYQCSTERQKCDIISAPVLVIILWNFLLISREIITSTDFYQCCTPTRQHQYRSSKWHYCNRQRTNIFKLIMHFIADADTAENYF